MKTPSEEELQRIVEQLYQFKEFLDSFEDPQACITYLQQETGLPRWECQQAYDCYCHKRSPAEDGQK